MERNGQVIDNYHSCLQCFKQPRPNTWIENDHILKYDISKILAMDTSSSFSGH